MSELPTIPCFSCPFCGRQKLELLHHTASHYSGFKVSCTGEGCYAEGPVRDTPIGAQRAWNAKLKKRK